MRSASAGRPSLRPVGDAPTALCALHKWIGRGVSLCVPGVRWRHPTHRAETAFRVRNHPWPSHSWQPPVAADFLSANRGPSKKNPDIPLRTAQASAACARPGAADGLGRVRPGARRLRRLSSNPRRTAGDRHPLAVRPPRPLEEPAYARMRRRSALSAQNRRFRGLGLPAQTSQASTSRGSHKTHSPENGCGRAIGRPILLRRQ